MSASLSYPVSALRSVKSKPCVTILEPDLAVLEYLRSALSSQYTLSLFSEEQHLIDRLEQAEQPDLLLIALHPGRDAAPLLSHIRSTRPRVPVVVLSFTAELKDIEVVIRLGVKGIILKPFIASDVEAAIEEHLALAEVKPAGRRSQGSSPQRESGVCSLLQAHA